MAQEDSNQGLKVVKPKISKNILLGIVVVLILLIVALVVYFTQFYKQNKTSQHKTQQTAGNVSLKSNLNLNESKDNNQSPTKQTSGYIISEYNGNEVTYYKVDNSAQKEKLLTVPQKKGSMGSEATLLPDGKTLVYTDKNYSLVSYNIETKSSTIIKKSTHHDASQGVGDLLSFGSPLSSPNGQKLLFKWYGYECGGAGLINTDGTDFQKLDGCTGNSFDWSPDSNKVVVGSGNNQFSGDSSELYVASANDFKNGKNLLPKNNNKNDLDAYKDVFEPKFSPNGQKIAFGYRYLNIGPDFNNQKKAESYRGLYVVDADGTNFKQVSDNRSFSTNPIWKNNSTLIYGLSDYYVGNHKNGIYSMNIDGTENTKIFSDDNNMYQPQSLSKDDQKLIYLANKVNKDDSSNTITKLYEYNFKTKQAKLLNTTGGASFVGWLQN